MPTDFLRKCRILTGEEMITGRNKEEEKRRNSLRATKEKKKGGGGRIAFEIFAKKEQDDTIPGAPKQQYIHEDASPANSFVPPFID